MIVNSVKKITNTPHLNLYDADFTNIKGTRGNWYFVSRREEPLVNITKNVDVDVVVIVPLLKTFSIYNLVVLKQERIPIGDFIYEFPAGLIDKGEDFELAAARELKEETGLFVKRFLRFDGPLFASPGLSDESFIIAYVEAEGNINPREEDTEILYPEIWDMNRIKKVLQEHPKIDCKLWLLISQFNVIGEIRI